MSGDEPRRGAATAALGRAARAAARRLGYEIVPAAALEEHALARHLARLFRQLDVQCVLDVGANRGQYHSFLRRQVGFDGLVVSFEPVVGNVARLRDQARRDPRWVVEGYALGGEDRRGDINVMKVDLLSSFLAPDPAGPAMFREVNTVDHVETVAVRRLDAVLGELRQRHGIGNLFLKLDTQGFDLEVLRGAALTLPTIRALQTELSLLPLYQGAPPHREVVDYLTGRGFAISALCPVARDQQQRVVELDCVMVSGSEPAAGR